jgi:hypothetical protein
MSMSEVPGAVVTSDNGQQASPAAKHLDIRVQGDLYGWRVVSVIAQILEWAEERQLLEATQPRLTGASDADHIDQG